MYSKSFIIHEELRICFYQKDEQTHPPPTKSEHPLKFVYNTFQNTSNTFWKVDFPWKISVLWKVNTDNSWNIEFSENFTPNEVI